MNDTLIPRTTEGALDPRDVRVADAPPPYIPRAATAPSAPLLGDQWPPSAPNPGRAGRSRPAHPHSAPHAHPAAAGPGVSAAHGAAGPGGYAAPGAPGPGAYAAPGVPARPHPASVQTLGTWALVLGIVCIFFNPLAGLSIAAGVCGIVALVRHGDFVRDGIVPPGRAIAIAGVVLAIVGFMRTSAFGWFFF